MHTAYTEKLKQMWADPVTREKMLAGSRKAAESPRRQDPTAIIEHRYRTARANRNRGASKAR